jgi:hypothetical protein
MHWHTTEMNTFKTNSSSTLPPLMEHLFYFVAENRFYVIGWFCYWLDKETHFWGSREDFRQRGNTF